MVQYSNALTQLAQEQLFLQLGIYNEATPGLTAAHFAALKEFDAYIRENITRVYLPKDNADLQLPADYFDNFVFHLSDSDKPNASIFVPDFLPDGKIHVVVTKGMLRHVENEDELMGVIAHEIAHNIQKISGSKANTKAEEIGADLTAMSHMKYGGYHPKYFKTVMKRLHEQRQVAPDLIRKVFMPHPSDDLREDVLDGFLQSNATEYSAIKGNVPYNKKIVDTVLALPDTNQALTDILNAQTSLNETVAQTNAFVQDNKTILYASKYNNRESMREYFYGDGLWFYILDHKNEESPWLLFSTQPDEEHTIPAVRVNPRYRKQIEKHDFKIYSNEGSQQEAAVAQVFDDIVATHDNNFPVLTNTFQQCYWHDDFRVQLSLLFNVGRYFFTKDFDASKCVPKEWRNVAAQIARLPDADEAEARQIQANLKPVREALACMNEFGMRNNDYTRRFFSHFLLPELPKFEAGQKHPYARWIEKARAYYKETGRTDSLAHEVLCTLRVQDIEAFPLQAKSETNGFLGIEYPRQYGSEFYGYAAGFSYAEHAFTPEQIEAYQPDYRLGYVTDKNDEPVYYKYDPKTFIVETVDTKALGSVSRAKEYREQTYNNMTLRENSLFHYDLKKRIADLATAPADEQLVDAAVTLAKYPGVITPDTPYVPETITWSLRTFSFTQDGKRPDKAVQKEVAARYPKLVTQGEFLFDYLGTIYTRNEILEAFLRAGEAAKTNPALALKLIETPEFWDLASWYGSPYYSSTFDAIYKERYFSILANEPFISHARQLNLDYNYREYLRQNFPELASQTFEYRIPQTGTDLNLGYSPLSSRYYHKRTGEIYGHLEDIEHGYIGDFLTAGRTDIPAPFLLRKVEPKVLSEQQMDVLKKDVSLRSNWPSRLNIAVPELRDFLYSLRDAQGFSAAPLYATELMDEYRARVFEKPAGPEQRALLTLLWRKKTNIFIPNQIRDDFFARTPENVGIWSGDLAEQVKTYKWLCHMNAFSSESDVERNVLAYLLDEIEKRPPTEREQLVFGLLSKRNSIEFPSLEKRAVDMWVDTVAEIMGGPDDMSSEYMRKAQPFIGKLQYKHPDKVAFDLTRDYGELSLELRSRISAALQEKLVSQERLSDVLEPHPDITGALVNDMKKGVLGGTFEIIYDNCAHNPDFARAISNFLLTPPSIQSAERLNEAVQNMHFNPDPAGLLSSAARHARPVWWLRIHEQFWSKPFELRTLILGNLSGFVYAKLPKTLQKSRRVDYMLERIFEKMDNPNKKAFQVGLKNYAEAVPDNEEYETFYLLAGCLAAQKPRENGEEMSTGEVVRTFLEAQGPAGIKVGQFMALQDGVDPEIQAELLKLTNHASTPSRAKVFELLRTYHPNVMAEVRQNGLGKLLGAASHYMTFDLNEGEVLSVSKYQSGLKAEKIYHQMIGAVEKTMIDQPENAAQLHIIRDAVMQAQQMNHAELNGNVGYVQMNLSKKLYDNVSMDIDGFHIDFRTMDWTRMPDPYRSYVSDGPVHWQQSYKIMEKAKGVDYTDLEMSPTKIALAKANMLLNLRAILMGGVFDDDRHQGQLKVEINGNQLRVNLFDTGSTSLQEPSPQEREELGAVLYTVISGLKENKNADVSKLLHAGVDKIRQKHNGKTPKYLAKVERAFANLKHFTVDVPADEMVPLLLRLVNTPNAVHPDIVRGMAAEASLLEKAVMMSVLPTNNMDSVLTEKVDETVLADRLDNILTLPQVTDKKAAYEALVNMMVIPEDNIFDHVEGCIANIPNKRDQIVVVHHLKKLLQTGIQMASDKKDALKIRRVVMRHLAQKGLPKELITAIGAKLPLGQRLLVKAAFFYGKLRFGHKKATQLIDSVLNRAIDILVKNKSELITGLTNNRLTIGEIDHSADVLPPLRSLKVNRTGTEGNRSIALNRKAYYRKKGASGGKE